MSAEGPSGSTPVITGHDRGDELVVATPERVAFRLETAGLGSRFVAHLIDVLALAGSLVALGLVAYGIGLLAADAGLLLFVVAGFLLVGGTWIALEALWSGRTLGKHVMRLRVVDARGGPITAGQAVVRNVVRIVDFLPVYYGVGVVAMFISPRNQRLGDMAAGTVVVRERPAVRLADLASAAPVQGAGGGPAAMGAARLDPRLRRFVAAYAQRRPSLPAARREQLAREAAPALQAALPDVVASDGPLAALDRLADELVR